MPLYIVTSHMLTMSAWTNVETYFESYKPKINFLHHYKRMVSHLYKADVEHTSHRASRADAGVSVLITAKDKTSCLLTFSDHSDFSHSNHTSVLEIDRCFPETDKKRRCC